MGIRFPGVILANQNRSVMTANKAASNVPKGFLAVYEGESEKEGFLVPVSYLNQPSFQVLLSIAEEEFGFDHPMGGVTVSCREDIFIGVISQLKGSREM